MIPCFAPFFGDLSRQRLSADIATSQGYFVSPKRRKHETPTGVVFRPLDICHNLPFSTPMKICGLWHCSHPPNYPNLPILFVSPIAFSKKSRYICGGESQRLTHPKGFSFVKSAEKGFECGLTPYRTATVSAELSSLNRQRSVPPLPLL